MTGKDVGVGGGGGIIDVTSLCLKGLDRRHGFCQYQLSTQDTGIIIPPTPKSMKTPTALLY